MSSKWLNQRAAAMVASNSRRNPKSNLPPPRPATITPARTMSSTKQMNALLLVETYFDAETAHHDYLDSDESQYPRDSAPPTRQAYIAAKLAVLNDPAARAELESIEAASSLPNPAGSASGKRKRRDSGDPDPRKSRRVRFAEDEERRAEEDYREAHLFDRSQPMFYQPGRWACPDEEGWEGSEDGVDAQFGGDSSNETGEMDEQWDLWEEDEAQQEEDRLAAQMRGGDVDLDFDEAENGVGNDATIDLLDDIDIENLSEAELYALSAAVEERLEAARREVELQDEQT
ncbi:unnamed protein product [Zymoseptoria tritici ST99CH_1E4]|uniref:Uncharacterized protein n=3 Tax=Zymoseptoria tritici TaxID=1047171 RepID=F9XNQ3_ZYMTI|nr:uncharacterized protein MYCGRDRAFT_97041 [Zymoseptoria tritici IPO323]EGP83128.1 hypothetical protein MYCGRDRAFT_97041 [Zymoseptoria tritici IPO323]SMR60924.1 unnamed protein product [Zymoseptoria tritici ST99CH_1E4]